MSDGVRIALVAALLSVPFLISAIGFAMTIWKDGNHEQ